VANVIGSGIARTLVDVDGDPVTVTGTALDVNIASGTVNLITGFATSTLQGGGLPSALSNGYLKVSIQEGNISGFATSDLQPSLGTAGTASANVITVQGVASMTPLTVDCDSSDVTVDNVIGSAVYARITDGSGVAAVNGDNELSVEINNIDPNAGTLTTKQLPSASVINGKVSVLDSSTEICDASAIRLSYTIVNDSDTVIYLAIEDAAVLNEGIRLNPNGGSFSDDFATDKVFGICAVSGKNVTVCQQFI